jgi:hypothetical protein
MMQVPNMKFSAAGLAATLLSTLVPLACRAQEFSADVVYLAVAAKPGVPAKASAPAPHDASRLYVSNERLRLETSGFDRTILLADRAEHTNFALFPTQKAYQPLSSAPSEYFRVGKADDACADWQKAVDHKISCEKVGPEAVAGRRTIKYLNKGASPAATAAVWIDVALRYSIKWEGAGASAELHNIKEAKQAAELFAVPADYAPLTPSKVKSHGFTRKPH